MPLARRSFCIRVAGLALVFLLPLAALGSEPPSGRRIALSGYDPVAYFVDGAPAKGKREHWYAFDDAVYLFRSAAHREKFAAQPERYAPQYAGFCAGGVSKGKRTEPDPEAWLIANGRLYVFEFKDRVPMFRQKIGEVAAQADANWPALKPR